MNGGANPEPAQVSGKVFRFLSAMHPALSKAERKRYAGYDPDKWYPWTSEMSAEFTDLMRRSPRDTSFARGFAYVAQRAIPEGGYVPTRMLFDQISRLPAAFRGPAGSGFDGRVDRPGHAVVSYGGMPGFANVCIAIQGELTQRIQATGAQSVVVRHSKTCRVNGSPQCEFEVEWSGEAPPANAHPIEEADLAATTGVESPSARADAIGAARARPDRTMLEELAPPRAAIEPVRETRDSRDSRDSRDASMTSTANQPPSPLDTDLTGEDLFLQLRKRLSEADRQARLYSDARSEVERLKLEVARMRAQTDAEVARAGKERDDVLAAMVDLKRRIRALVADE
jgi:hypothetical protein